jgi:predicted transcriptional regulator YdeE
MDYTQVELPALCVVGIAVRTRNAHGQSHKDLGELWTRFYREKIADRISDRDGEDLLCVYTDYEDQAHGWYTTILGYQVPEPSPNLGLDLVAKTIAASKYHLYVSTGTLPDCVQQTWLRIWQEANSRSYVADFDRYGPGAFSADLGRVETWLGVR